MIKMKGLEIFEIGSKVMKWVEKSMNLMEINK